MAQRTDIRYVQFYTDGSAARKVAPLVPLKTMKLPKTRKIRRVAVFVDPVAVLSIAMAVVMAILILVGLVRLNAAQAEMETMAAYVDTLKQENAELHHTFHQGYDLEQIERTAISMGYVPREQVTHISVEVSPVEIPQEPTGWERFTTFLTGLFA